MHRVLVTGVGGNVAQGVIKALRAGKRPYYIVGIDMEPLSVGFSLVNSHYVTARTGDFAFKEQLFAILKQERIEAIYVCSPGELGFFSQFQNEIEATGAAVFVNPPDVVRIGSDKLLTVRFLKENGFCFPASVEAADGDGVKALINAYGFPLLLKPRAGFTSKNVFIVRSLEEIRAANILVPDLIAQRYLPDHSREYTAGTVSGADKKVRAVIVLHRDINQGTTYRTELVEDPALSVQVAKIVEALGSVGVCNLQFRLCDGQLYVFEINPRFSGTCGIRYLYGFNDAELVFDLIKLKIDVNQPGLSKGVVLRYWNEIFIGDEDFSGMKEGSRPHRGLQTVIKGPVATAPQRKK
jgi:carbamoyl-phosphate synthase large subunit